ncbi:N-terminal cleavage protein [Opitutaceae bacterium TAV5]|nr:N-terminal cleavage protein [Opitutaceae bacterium TAV5]
MHSPPQTLPPPQTCPTSRPLHRHSAFTLIELLAVIAIIGVLAALAFTGLRAARVSAWRTESKSNLRQIGLAVALYAQDNRDLLPEVEPDSDTSRYWWSHVSPYLTGREKSDTWSEFTRIPTLRSTWQSRKIAGHTGKAWLDRGPSYGMNGRLGPAIAYPSGLDRRVRLASVPLPSRTLLCSESGFNSQTPLATLTPNYLRSSACEPKGGTLVYNGGAIAGVSHLLWLDGHVTATSDIEAYVTGNYSPGGAENVWNRGF